MRFKILLLVSLIIGLNLYGFEPLSPEEAMVKFNSDFLQINDYPLHSTMDYNDHNTLPSFNCYDTKGKYKFKKYSLEDFICQSYTLAFRDNYFADLYNLIIKENPSLKDKAIKIARDRIKESKKECVIYSKEQYDYGFIENKALFVSESIGCVSDKYRHFTVKLALMLYGNDKELFKRIYSKDYEYFKDVFEDTISVYDLKFEGVSVRQKEENIRISKVFEEKYKDYDLESFGYAHFWDASYVLLVQYSLIDENGHLVLPENRKEE